MQRQRGALRLALNAANVGLGRDDVGVGQHMIQEAVGLRRVGGGEEEGGRRLGGGWQEVRRKVGGGEEERGRR